MKHFILILLLFSGIFHLNAMQNLKGEGQNRCFFSIKPLILRGQFDEAQKRINTLRVLQERRFPLQDLSALETFLKAEREAADEWQQDAERLERSRAAESRIYFWRNRGDEECERHYLSLWWDANKRFYGLAPDCAIHMLRLFQMASLGIGGWRNRTLALELNEYLQNVGPHAARISEIISVGDVTKINQALEKLVSSIEGDARNNIALLELLATIGHKGAQELWATESKGPFEPVAIGNLRYLPDVFKEEVEEREKELAERMRKRIVIGAGAATALAGTTMLLLHLFNR